MKFGYDGATFHGLARQPGLRTIEGEVVKALSGAYAVRDIRTSRFQSASRTDRGVSALGNGVAFDSSQSRIAVAFLDALTAGQIEREVRLHILALARRTGWRVP